MKKTKILIIAAFVIAFASAFTTSRTRPAFQSVLWAEVNTDLPCDETTAICGNGSGICTDVTNTKVYYPTTDIFCTTPLKKP